MHTGFLVSWKMLSSGERLLGCSGLAYVYFNDGCDFALFEDD